MPLPFLHNLITLKDIVVELHAIPFRWTSRRFTAYDWSVFRFFVKARIDVFMFIAPLAAGIGIGAFLLWLGSSQVIQDGIDITNVSIVHISEIRWCWG